MLARCPTDVAVLLAAVPDANGVLRLPTSGDATAPGLHVRVQPLAPIAAQLVEAAAAAIDLGPAAGMALSLVDGFADPVTLANGEAATLYVGRVSPGAATAPASWPSVPDLLRAMAKNRSRVPYLRAWQVLAGGLDDSVKALDAAEVAKALRASLKPADS
jgi:hypothetical protein